MQNVSSFPSPLQSHMIEKGLCASGSSSFRRGNPAFEEDCRSEGISISSSLSEARDMRKTRAVPPCEKLIQVLPIILISKPFAPPSPPRTRKRTTSPSGELSLSASTTGTLRSIWPSLPIFMPSVIDTVWLSLPPAPEPPGFRSIRTLEASANGKAAASSR